MASPHASESDEPVWRAGLRGARANLVPGIALQVVAVGLVAAYYRWPAAEVLLSEVAGMRSRIGVVFPIGITALFGGVIPFFYLRLRRATRAAHPWRDLLFMAVYWGIRGFEIDLMYRMLAATVGTGRDPLTLAIKVFFDQFVYCPLWAVPWMALAYGWRNEGYSWGRLRERIRGRFWRREVLPVYLASCALWVPAVAAVYSLPLPLQLPLCNVVLCFFTLMVAHIATHQAEVRGRRYGDRPAETA